MSVIAPPNCIRVVEGLNSPFSALVLTALTVATWSAVFLLRVPGDGADAVAPFRPSHSAFHFSFGSVLPVRLSIYEPSRFLNGVNGLSAFETDLLTDTAFSPNGLVSPLLTDTPLARRSTISWSLSSRGSALGCANAKGAGFEPSPAPTFPATGVPPAPP